MTSPFAPPSNDEILVKMQEDAYKSELYRFYKIQAREQIKLQVAEAVKQTDHPDAHLLPNDGTEPVQYSVVEKIGILASLLLDIPRILLQLCCYALILWLFYAVIIRTVLQ